MVDAARNIATAVSLALLMWVGSSLQEMKVSMALVNYRMAQLEKKYEVEKQYVQLTR